MVSTAAMMAQPEEKEYFSTSIKMIDELLDWHGQNPELVLSINALNRFKDSVTVEDLHTAIQREYPDFLDVFQKKKIETLLPHHKYDHKIKLTDGVDTVIRHCPLYSMSPYKLEKVKEYLEENLVKEFIKPSKASYASPILFTQKKDGGL